jgi:hypothetical protein
MIYNPIKSRGYVAEARDSKRWLTVRWNTEETLFDCSARDVPLQARNKDLLERYGKESNVYRIRVLGLPPIAEQDVFIPWEWVQDAVNRDITPNRDDPIVMGVDPGAGGDNTAIAIRQGSKILGIHRFNTPDDKIFLQNVVKIWQQYEPDIINIDEIGIGWGLRGPLERLGYRVESVDVRRKARNRDEYELVRDELWGTLKKHFQDGTISIPNDQELIDQLGSIKVKDYVKGKMKIPSKKDMRKADSIGGSPDEADAVCLTYAVPDELLRKIHQVDDDDDRERSKPQLRNRVTGY